MEYFGGIETGGTKVNCMVASDPEHVLAYERIPTTTPDKTIGDILAFFRRFRAEHSVKLETIGLGSFGPVDLQPTSPTYGYITSTPKPGWQNAPLLPAIANELDISYKTVANTCSLIKGKLGARSLPELMRIALKHLPQSPGQS